MTARDAEEEEAKVDPTPSGGMSSGMTRKCRGQMSLELTKQEQNEDEDDTYKTLWVHSR